MKCPGLVEVEEAEQLSQGHSPLSSLHGKMVSGSPESGEAKLPLLLFSSYF